MKRSTVASRKNEVHFEMLKPPDTFLSIMVDWLRYRIVLQTRVVVQMRTGA